MIHVQLFTYVHIPTRCSLYIDEQLNLHAHNNYSTRNNEGYDLLKYGHNEIDFSKFELWWHEVVFCFKAK